MNTTPYSHSYIRFYHKNRCIPHILGECILTELIIDFNELRHNIKTLQHICRKRKLELLGIIKGCYAFAPLLTELQKQGIHHLGLSKVADSVRFQPILSQSPTLITLPALNEIENVVRYFQTSVNSELTTIRKLSEAALSNKLHHTVILMVDNGDRREGCLPEHVLSTVRQIRSIENAYFHFQGLGSNLGCCYGTLPDFNNLNLLNDLAHEVEKELGIEVKTVSIGGSVLLDWLEHHPLPDKFNQLRLGEAIFLGNIPSINRTHPLLSNRVIRMRGQVLEIKDRPAQPGGQQGRDALGNTVKTYSRGWRKRAIVNIGVIDASPKGLIPQLSGIEVITGNTDYTVIDITECNNDIGLGDSIEFGLNYDSMIRAFLSPFVDKIPLHVTLDNRALN